MATKKSVARNLLLLNYHAFVAIHPLIAVFLFQHPRLFTSTNSSPTDISLCYALSRKPRFKLTSWWHIAVKAAVVVLVLGFATATWVATSYTH